MIKLMQVSEGNHVVLVEHWGTSNTTHMILVVIIISLSVLEMMELSPTVTHQTRRAKYKQRVLLRLYVTSLLDSDTCVFPYWGRNDSWSCLLSLCAVWRMQSVAGVSNLSCLWLCAYQSPDSVTGKVSWVMLPILLVLTHWSSLFSLWVWSRGRPVSPQLPVDPSKPSELHHIRDLLSNWSIL